MTKCTNGYRQEGLMCTFDHFWHANKIQPGKGKRSPFSQRGKTNPRHLYRTTTRRNRRLKPLMKHFGLEQLYRYLERMWRGTKESQKWSRSQKIKPMDLDWKGSRRMGSGSLPIRPVPNPKEAWSRESGPPSQQARHRWASRGSPKCPPPHLTPRKLNTVRWKFHHYVDQYHDTNRVPNSAKLPELLGNLSVCLQAAPYFIPQSIYFLLPPFSSSCKHTESLPSQRTSLHSPSIMVCSQHSTISAAATTLPCSLSVSVATTSSHLLGSHHSASPPICSTTVCTHPC